jgi:hypothetical protein
MRVNMPLVGRRGPRPALRARSACGARIALVALALVLATAPGRASELELLSVGVRLRVGEQTVLGEQQPESFRAYDVAATIRLPWQQPLSPAWAVGTRLLASAGVLQGAEKSSGVLSLIPLLALHRQDGRFTLDLGAGLALLGRHRYAEQDFGGPLQVALTLGVAVPLHERIAVGYRFMHYSDGRAYGRDTTGADFHMVELIYRY